MGILTRGSLTVLLLITTAPAYAGTPFPWASVSHNRQHPMDPINHISGPPPYDWGGQVNKYTAIINEYRRHPERLLKISGTCASACTLFLAAPNVCVSRATVMWFHAPYDNRNGRIATEYKDWMLNYYPPQIRGWVKASGALDTIAFKRSLIGEQIISLGFKACDDEPPINWSWPIAPGPGQTVWRPETPRPSFVARRQR